MFVHNLKVKGFTSHTLVGDPCVSLKFDSVLTLEDVESILEALRKPVSDISEPLSFKIELEALEY